MAARLASERTTMNSTVIEYDSKRHTVQKQQQPYTNDRTETLYASIPSRFYTQNFFCLFSAHLKKIIEKFQFHFSFLIASNLYQAHLDC